MTPVQMLLSTLFDRPSPDERACRKALIREMRLNRYDPDYHHVCRREAVPETRV